MNSPSDPWRLPCVAMALLAASLTIPSAQAWSATPAEIIPTCEKCHGPGGDSRLGTTPRLNGQRAGYVLSRLQTLTAQSRNNPHAQIGMLKDLASLDGATRAAIAAYFAGQSPARPKAGGAAAAEGKTIFQKGSAGDNVVACAQCHGADGEGHDATPRIAGQHADYLKAQLRLFNLKFRGHAVMNPNTKTMSDKSMDALVSYLAND